jgi:excisionase family DNA binding protein
MKRVLDGELPAIVTTPQLAKHLQVTERTVYAWRNERRIPFWQINARVIRYRLADVEKALATK